MWFTLNNLFGAVKEDRVKKDFQKERQIKLSNPIIKKPDGGAGTETKKALRSGGSLYKYINNTFDVSHLSMSFKVIIIKIGFLKRIQKES